MSRTLSESVLRYIRERGLARAGDRVCVAVSGGADSVALLRILLDRKSELGVVLSVAHVNHGLRGGEADQDALFVAALAAEHGLEFHRADEPVQRHARENEIGIEAAGRELRYAFFTRLLREGNASRVATAHTADDQAETVLLRVMRGAGTQGLSGILPERGEAFAGRWRKTRPDADSGQPAIIRPLLATRRAELREYLAEIGQAWREDSSNADQTFKRNRVRSELLPLLERDYNPGIVRALSATAEIARGEEEFWTAYLDELLPVVISESGALRVHALLAQPLAVQRRLVRIAGGPPDFDHVEKVLALARRATRAERILQFPNGLVCRCDATELRFMSGPAEPQPVPSRAIKSRVGRAK